MHRRVYEQFEKICTARNVSGRVLEIGATPDDSTLLCMRSLENATEKIGVNIDGPYTYRDFEILAGNANELTEFADGSFDLVLCNAMLEHDKWFYKTIAEIKRVTRSGGTIVIGVPSYRRVAPLETIQSIMGRLPLLKQWSAATRFDAPFTATLTFKVHDWPGDYYRFSEQAVREVFFEGCRDVEICSVMSPPRLIGSGVKL